MQKAVAVAERWTAAHPHPAWKWWPGVVVGEAVRLRWAVLAAASALMAAP